jgi:uncharacterized membrane protein
VPTAPSNDLATAGGMRLFLERLSSRYWVLPTVIAACLTLLLGFVRTVPNDAFRDSLLASIAFDASAEGARLLLSAVAGAVMTVVGVLFSITVVVLQQASAQFSPRVIDNFVRSLRSQFVFGFYIGTFSYCLLLVRSIRDTGHAGRIIVPTPAISVAILLAVVCLALLIHYIHHIVHAIQSTHIVREIVRDSIAALRGEWESLDQERGPAPESGSALRFEAEIRPAATGYLQALRWRAIARILRRERWELEVRVRAGDYMDENDTPLAILRTSRPLASRAQRRIAAAFEIGEHRTHAQDPRFGVRQLVDIALRALSPGINDPTTALESLDGISSVLLAGIRLPSAPEVLRLSPTGAVRVHRLEYPDLLELSFAQILHFAADHEPVRRRIGEILDSCLAAARDPERQACLTEWRRRLEPRPPAATARAAS